MTSQALCAVPIANTFTSIFRRRQTYWDPTHTRGSSDFNAASSQDGQTEELYADHPAEKCIYI